MMKGVGNWKGLLLVSHRYQLMVKCLKVSQTRIKMGSGSKAHHEHARKPASNENPVMNVLKINGFQNHILIP